MSSNVHRNRLVASAHEVNTISSRASSSDHGEVDLSTMEMERPSCGWTQQPHRKLPSNESDALVDIPLSARSQQPDSGDSLDQIKRREEGRSHPQPNLSALPRSWEKSQIPSAAMGA
jgi:hypothetical protein